MKKLLYIIIVIVAISCTSQEEFPESHQLPSTRGIVDSNTNSVTNPTLLTDWENLTTVVLNTSTPTNPKTESLPWISGSTTLIPSYIRNDIKKALEYDLHLLERDSKYHPHKSWSHPYL